MSNKTIVVWWEPNPATGSGGDTGLAEPGDYILKYADGHKECASAEDAEAEEMKVARWLGVSPAPTTKYVQGLPDGPWLPSIG